MKKNTLAALIPTILATGQLTSLQAHIVGLLNVWEDIKKSADIKTAVSNFKEQYNVKVNLQKMPYAQQLKKLCFDGPADIGPDVLVIPNDQSGGAMIRGPPLPLSTDQAKQDTFAPASINAFRMDNALYGIPKTVETLVLIYDKDLISKSLDSLQTWLDYSETQHEQNKYGLLVESDQIYYSWGAIGPMGGYIFARNDSGGSNPQQVGLNTPGAAKTVTFLKKSYVERVFLMGVFGDNGLNAIDSLFTEKRAAAVVNGPWAFQPYEATGINYGVAPLPTLSNGKLMSSFLDVKGYVVSTQSKDKALAQRFIEFINQPRYVKARYVITGEILLLKATINDPVTKNDQKASAIAVQSVRAVAMPGIPEMGEVWGPTDATLRLSLIDKQAPQAALDNAVKQVTTQTEVTQASNQWLTTA